MVIELLAAGSDSGAVRDIYTGADLSGVFDLDHFIPWSFVAHDQLWNLVPVVRSTNSAKSDAVPNIDRYVPALAALHRNAVHALRGHPQLLTDHVEFFTEEIASLLEKEIGWFEQHYVTALRPLAEIAKLQGFPFGWVASAEQGAASETPCR